MAWHMADINSRDYGCTHLIGCIGPQQGRIGRSNEKAPLARPLAHLVYGHAVY